MALLDVNQVILDPDFADRFQVVRRAETITQLGRSAVLNAPIEATGVLYPTGDNSLVRQEDQQHGVKTLTCVTPFRLRQAAPGYQPDLVIFRGVTFVVRAVEDYAQFGAGFVVAQCSSLETIDAPPQ